MKVTIHFDLIIWAGIVLLVKTLFNILFISVNIMALPGFFIWKMEKIIIYGFLGVMIFTATLVKMFYGLICDIFQWLLEIVLPECKMISRGSTIPAA
jgi:hypothetical protein